MSQKSRKEYLESCRERYPSRNRAGRSAMIDEVSDVLGWDRKHTIKALNGQVSHGKKALGRKSGKASVEKGPVRPQLNTAEMLESKENGTVLPDLGMTTMFRCRVRYFSDGAVIGSKAFVNEAFANARERFGAKRRDGARKLRG